MSPSFLVSDTLGNLLSSSMREMMFMGLLAIMSNASWLSVNSMCCQLMSSRLYSSCSSLKTWRTKNCCRFSLAKLMHSCSKLQWKNQARSGKREIKKNKNWPDSASNQTAEYERPVDNEVLEAEDVQQPDRPAYDVAFTRRWPVYSSVNLIHDPHKQPAVDPLEDET